MEGRDRKQKFVYDPEEIDPFQCEDDSQNSITKESETKIPSGLSNTLSSDIDSTNKPLFNASSVPLQSTFDINDIALSQLAGFSNLNDISSNYEKIEETRRMVNLLTSLQNETEKLAALQKYVPFGLGKSNQRGPCLCGYKHFFQGKIKDLILRFPLENIGEILFAVDIDDDPDIIASDIIRNHSLPINMKKDIVNFIEKNIEINCSVSGWKYTPKSSISPTEYHPSEEERKRVKTDDEQKKFNRELRELVKLIKPKPSSKKISADEKHGNTQRIMEETKRIYDEKRKKKLLQSTSGDKSESNIIDANSDSVNKQQGSEPNTETESKIVEFDSFIPEINIKETSSPKASQMKITHEEDMLSSINQSIVNRSKEFNNESDLNTPFHLYNDIHSLPQEFRIECSGHYSNEITKKPSVGTNKLQWQSIREWIPCFRGESCSRCTERKKIPLVVEDSSGYHSNKFPLFQNKTKSSTIHTFENSESHGNGNNAMLEHLQFLAREIEKNKSEVISSINDPLKENKNISATVKHHEVKTVSDTDLIIPIDPSLPKTKIKVRLHDGTEILKMFNLSHKVSDIRNLINIIHPIYNEKQYKLMTIRPRKELENPDTTIDDAQLANSVIVQKMIE